MTVLTPTPFQKFFDNNGAPLAGGLLFTYAAGTSTKVTTWKDANGSEENTNPIVLDFRGECDLWITQGTSYKYVLSPSDDTDPPTNPIKTINNASLPSPTGFAADTATYLTENDETSDLPNSRQLLAGTNITFNDAVAGQRTISASGGGASNQFAAAFVSSAGSLLVGINVSSTSKESTGSYLVNIDPPGTPFGDTNSVAIVAATSSDREVKCQMASENVVTVTSYDLSGTPADETFSIIIIGPA